MRRCSYTSVYIGASTIGAMQVYPIPGKIGGKIILFKDATIPVDVADGGGVMGYAATFDREPDCYGDVIAPSAGSSPYVGNSSQADVFNDYYARRIASEMGSRDRR